MPLQMIAAAAAVALAIPVLWWSVASARSPAPGELVARNLQRGSAAAADLRELLLSRSASERAVRPALRALAAGARRLTPVGWVEALERRVGYAGASKSWPIERVLAAKLLLLLGMVAAGVWDVSRHLSLGRFLLWAVLGLTAYLVPDLLLIQASSKRAKQIQHQLPDTLDQVTISVEAGLGFESALSRVARAGSGPLAEEMIRMLQEIQIGVPRHRALRGMLDRSKVPELRHVILAIIQSESYGLPIAHVLRIQAKELRTKRRQRAEERAMKIPVKIVFPLAVCILPSLFIVILGPAAIRIFRFFSGANLP